MALWMVRGGRDGEKEETALHEGLAIIGWDALPDLSRLPDRDALRRLLADVYPGESINTRNNWESQIWPFLRGFQPGDIVAMPLKARPTVMFGVIAEGGYRHLAANPAGLRHARPVRWAKEIPRDRIDPDLRYSLGAYLTVCRIQRNDAEARLGRLAGLLAGSDAPTPIEPRERDEAADVDAGLDLSEIARDGIRTVIARQFTGHRLTALIGAILAAQGYTLRISPEGADGGVDILAGRGPLGFDRPRIAVQVKSGDTATDIRTVRELKGVVQAFAADHGLFVSWAGFRGTVEKETARDFFGMRLWTSDDVIRAIEDHYDHLPADIQADLPLKRIWAVVPND